MNVNDNYKKYLEAYVIKVRDDAVKCILQSKGPYELYVRNQLTDEQNMRLDSINMRLPLCLGESDSGFNDILDAVSYSESRMSVEAHFLIDKMNLNVHSKVFDACLGTGATTIGLKRRGIHNILSNDLDSTLIGIASNHASKENIHLNCTSYDWRNLPVNLENASLDYSDRNWRELPVCLKEAFDSVICVGNSLTYIMRHDEQQQVVDNFARILKSGGKLAIDTRNYTELLRGNFQNKGTGPYREIAKVNMSPKYVASDMVIFNYASKDNTPVADLVLYPFKDGEIECLMRTAGLKDIRIYGDYQEKFDPKNVDFYTIIGTKN